MQYKNVKTSFKSYIFFFEGTNEVLISLPILSLLDIRKLPKLYLEAEKLAMKNDGIEILTTNFLCVKVKILVKILQIYKLRFEIVINLQDPKILSDDHLGLAFLALFLSGST